MKKQGGKTIPQGKIPVGGVALSLSRIGSHLEVQIATDNPQFLVRGQGPYHFKVFGLESQTLPHELHFGRTMCYYVEPLNQGFSGAHC